MIEYHMPPNYTNYLHFPRRRAAFSPSFDEMMAHLNDGGATSVPFVRSRGEIGFVPSGTCLPLGGGGDGEMEAAAAAAKDKSSRCGSSDERAEGKNVRLRGLWMTAVDKRVSASCFC